jgi:hypothetical protein
LLRNCFIGLDGWLEEAFQAICRPLKKGLAAPAVRWTVPPAISGLTAPQGFVFSLFLVPVRCGSGAALGEIERKCVKPKSDGGSECCRSPCLPKFAKGGSLQFLREFRK